MHGNPPSSDPAPAMPERLELSTPAQPESIEAAIHETIRYLESEAAREALRQDPYWPKWDGPWWRITTLFELGLVERVPEGILAALLEAVHRHYLHTFPFRLEELPPGIDPYRHVVCHCALGTVYQVLSSRGFDVDREMPWARPWFLRYQLPDGGLNCDELVYLRPEPHSSVLSTLPPLEAVLFHTPRPFTPEEEAFLDRGAAYLITRRLFRSRRTGEVVDPTWLELTFPRFYDYDLLRGLAFLTAWAERLDRSMPRTSIDEACQRLRSLAREGRLATGIRAWQGVKTWALQPEGGWAREPSRTFPLLELVSVPGQDSPWLTRQWEEVQARLGRLEARGLLTEAEVDGSGG